MLTRLLRRFLAPHWLALLAVVLLQAGATVASLFLPTLNADIIDNGVAKGDTNYIWATGGIMLAVSFAQIVCQYLGVYFGAQVAMKFGRDVRAALFDRVLSFSTREVNRFGAPSLITRNTNDVQQVQMLVMMTCIMLIGAPITMVFGIIMALSEDVGLAWLIGVAVGLLALVIGVLIFQLTPLFRSMQTRIDTLNRVLREQIGGLRVIRAFVREPLETQRFAKANADVTESALAVGRRVTTMFPALMFIMNISSVGVMWFGGLRIDSGDLTVGQLFAFLAYLIQILISVMMASMLTMLVPRAAVCAVRIQEVLHTESTVVPPAKPVHKVLTHGEVRLDRVEFTYPGAEAPVLRNIDFTVRAGETTAIIGSTGSGKTTLVNLLPRLFDATGGRVLIDGVDVRELDPDVLWSEIGLVPQRAFLFTGTVASNLRYGNPEATDEQLWHALEVAQAKDFVQAMPAGLESPIAQGGTNVSGGQRQRLAIARALVRKPDIYVFDDSFSALDVATDARLRAALAPETADAAVVIVAQRVSTIMSADQIVVLEDGQIVGIGKHADLLATCPTYAEIVDSQLSLEAVA